MTRRSGPGVAIVTGASRGIGAAVAHRLADDGLRVVLTARNEDALASRVEAIRARGGTACATVADAADLAALDRVVEQATATYGRIDVLVNNAGMLPPATRSHDIDVDDWERTLRVNLTAPWYLACRCRDTMIRTGGGVIVNVTSSAASYPTVGLSPYNTSKAGLTMLTKALALEWARDDIRVVGVAPGKIGTRLAEPVLAYTERTGRRPNPLGRIGEPHEVADLIAYLVADTAAFITGCVVTIDGGELAGTSADAAR